MEQNKVEMLVLEQTANKVRDQELQQLAELQLALVGGGIGETTL